MKAYPLEVKVLHEFEGGPTGHFSRGHHDKGTFINAVATLDPASITERLIDNLDHYVRHEWWRCKPEGKGMHSWIKATPGSAGAFPVTVVG